MSPRRCLPAALLVASVALPLLAQQPAEAWWRNVPVLAHDALEGRDAGSPVPCPPGPRA